MVSIHVLGSFTAEWNGGPVPLGGRRQRAVLARLAVARGAVVSVDRMVEEIWQGAPPARAVTSLQAYVSNLRRLLEPGRAPRTPATLLVSAPPGYALRLPDGAVDAWRFERLLGEAREVAQRQPETARRLLGEALSLWQGAAYAEFVDESWARAEVARLDELRLVARELNVVAGLRSEQAAVTVPEAELLTLDEPLREEGWRLHALALWAAGRQADALATLRRARAVLAAEVGLDPGPALNELEAAILGGRTAVLRTATAAPQHRPPTPPEGRNIPAPSGRPATGTRLFVGREAEFARLVEAAGRAATAGPGVALVTGEAGLGKSELLERLGERLRGDGWLVAVGQATDDEGAPPAWPWVAALRTIAAAAPPPAESTEVLAPLLSDRASGQGPEEDVAAGRFRLNRAVSQWLAAVSRERPLAVLLDDLHWADAETLALLTGLTDLPPGTPVLVVAAYRPNEIEGPLTDQLAVLAGRSPLRLPLPGLPASAVAEVIKAVGTGPVDTGTVAALAERTGGNPFYVWESARLLSSEGALVALSEVPEGVRDVVRRRLGRLPEAGVAVLRLAAVVGREADVELLVGAADTDEDGVLGALDAGLVAGLLTEPAPGRVRFTHALVRDTLLADLSGLRARRMHGRIAAGLERLGSSDVSALAHHFARAAASATAAKGVHYGLRAADLAAARYAHDAAADLLAAALDCFDRTPVGPSGDRAAERVDLLGRLLRAQVRAGAVMAARATRQRAIECAVGTGRSELVVRALTAWSEPTPWQTRPYDTVDEPVVALLGRSLDLPDLEPAARCGLLLAYCAELSDERNPRVRAAAEEAVEIATALGDPGLRARALAALLRELDIEHEGREPAVRSEELVRLATEHDLPAFRWFGLFSLSTAAAAEGDVAGAYGHIDTCVELARAYRMPGPVVVGQTALATRALIEGRTEDAEELYAEATAGMARQGSPHADGFLQIATATVRAAQGRLGEFVPQARQLTEEYGPPMADLLAAALCAAGQQDEARTILARVGPLRTDYLLKVFATFRAMATVALGEKELASELYLTLLPHRDAPPPSSGFTLAIRPVAYTLGELARLLGRDAEAAGHFAHAAGIAERWSTALGHGSSG
ncbi:BTAD domain-containing putative transcriptional regulator [Streptomyces sp. CB01881]|uniref:BTAD domain-containing putative transcriptional regulator n=1 Tax=Streptomyces sp. CB01881 TaxID=2078691 RepID=UPI000CDC4E4F|nr:BTAD domain-containing putative transcriptional regulator [Streptomyces sp. CB01881]AUY54306.1 transcriptional regulator [Streptomyces sp. CB01881]TYC75210.1 transcriptional regulator [Streptomyces sp. CB01881]